MKQPLLSPRFEQWLRPSVYMFAALAAFNVIWNGELSRPQAYNCFLISMVYGLFIINLQSKQATRAH